MNRFATQVLSAQSKADFEQATRKASEILLAGEVAALPTETVYGLAGNALAPESVRRIYAVKGRPQSNPLIVHVVGWAMLQRCVREWDEAAARLAQSFWPGPLTLVVRRAALIPDEITAGGDTVAVRWPRHPFMQAVIQKCGFPLAAPSANRSNELSPTRAEHVLVQLNGAIPLVVDGGDAAVGIESTVVDLVNRPARVLRPGMVHMAALQAAGVLVEKKSTAGKSGGAAIARSPGMAARHYAPKAQLIVKRWADRAAFEQIVRRTGQARSAISIVARNVIPAAAGFARVSTAPRDAEGYARALFAELHACDAAGCELILVESPPEGAAWEGIWDRLKRASGRL